MRRVVMVLIGMLLVTWPCMGAPYRIEVLQVGKIEAFDVVMQSMQKELARQGLVEGQNVRVHRTIIEANLAQGDGNMAAEIQTSVDKMVGTKPDLVLTIGTPATKAAKDKALSTHIPVVFSCVFNPLIVGCISPTKAGPGFTGVSNYIDPTDVLNVAKLAFPGLKRVGVVHSDDESTLAFIDDVKAKAGKLKITVLSKQVDKASKLTPAARELIAKGAQAFLIPADVYYGMRDYEPVKELIAIQHETKIPAISCTIGGPKDPHGAVLLVTPSFQVLGELTGRQIAKIIKQGQKPETLPILRQEHLYVQVDTEVAKALGITLPNQILMMSKPRE